MTPATRSRIYLALQVALLVAVVWLVWHRLAPELKGVSAADFARWRPAAGLLLLSTLGLTLLHLVQAFLWRRVVIDVGSPAPDARTTIRVYFVSGLARFIPGTLWQFAGLAALGHEAGISPLAAAAAGAIGNIAFVATGAVFLAFTLPGVAGASELQLGVLVAALAVAGVFVFTGTSAGERVRAWVGRRAPARLQPALELAGRIRPGHALAWTLGYGACWILLGASYVGFVAAFVPGAAVHARALAGIMAASYLGGFLVLFAPGGLGVREFIMIGLLTGIVPAPAAVVIAVAHRIWFFVAEGLALASFLLLPRRSGPRDDAAGPGGGSTGAGANRQALEVL